MLIEGLWTWDDPSLVLSLPGILSYFSYSDLNYSTLLKISISNWLDIKSRGITLDLFEVQKGKYRVVSLVTWYMCQVGRRATSCDIWKVIEISGNWWRTIFTFHYLSQACKFRLAIHAVRMHLISGFRLICTVDDISLFILSDLAVIALFRKEISLSPIMVTSSVCGCAR